MKLISLSGKKGEGKFAMVDDEDFERVAVLLWHVDAYGYPRHNRYLETYTDAMAAGRKKRPKTEALKLHRYVLGLPYKNGEEVDHINRNKLDNCKSNLRILPLGKNAQNYPSKEGSSKYRGVRFHKNKWEASGRANGKKNHIGSFNTEEEANQAAIQWRKANMPFSVD